MTEQTQLIVSAVDAMMAAYPNVERRHIIPAEKGLQSIGHFGFFRPKSKILWQDTLTWLNQQINQTLPEKPASSAELQQV